MSGFEEETYSTIFSSLKHSVRRRILRMLSEKPRNFSDMLEALGISSSHLTYHLENLGELVSKTENGEYKLSTFGKAAVTTMSKVEEVPKVTETKRPSSLSTKWKSLFVVLMIGLVVLAGISYAQYQSLNKISSDYERLKDLVDLVENGASLTHEYTLRYKADIFELEIGYPVHMFFDLPVCVIYNLNDNSTLYLALSIGTLPPDSQVSISLQEGNVFDHGTNETAPVIWSVDTNANSIFSVSLVSKGWYTISLFGPVMKFLDATTGKATGYIFLLPGVADCWVDIRMVHDGNYSPFIVKPR
jgi:DNA-binding transcriptional ArsR family regulator